MKTAICYLSADKPELVRQSLPPLVQGAIDNQYHLFIVDGSKTKAGEETIFEVGYPTATIRSNVHGGAGAALVYALTWLLDHEENYDVVGLVENDVLLSGDWYPRTAALFQRGLDDRLEVGAASARCFEDRILFQRDEYAIVHNSGAGMVLLSRVGARIILDNFRTAWSTDNRRIFALLAGTDIGAYWAFRTNEHFLTADWHWDACLAAHGLASLALTPSPVEMIGQNPPLAEQGLAIAQGPVAARRDDEAFALYKHRLWMLNKGHSKLGVETQFYFDSNTGTWTYFPHQMHMIGGRYGGDWRLKEARGWGTFAWRAEWVHGEDEDGVDPTLVVPVFGPCSILISGGKIGSQVEVIDEQSGFKVSPMLPPEGEGGHVLQLQVPGGIHYRNIRITALTPGCVFYGIQTREKQMVLPNVGFDYSNLPLV